MTKFLSLPLRSINYKITEGWIYSEEEQTMHGEKDHFAIDYALPRGSEVLAAAAGWAVSSYRRQPSFNKETGKKRLYLEKAVTNSRGYFVLVYHPNIDLFTAYFHLEKISPKIPFTKPRKLSDGTIDSKIPKMPGNMYKNYPKAIWIERGDTLGFIGDSGLTWGYDDYPKRPDPEKYPSWDETHLHFSIYRRDEKGQETFFDPYDIKKNFQFYPWQRHKKPVGKNHLWLNLKGGLPE